MIDQMWPATVCLKETNFYNHTAPNSQGYWYWLPTIPAPSHKLTTVISTRYQYHDNLAQALLIWNTGML